MNISSGRLELGMERGVKFTSWKEQEHDHLWRRDTMCKGENVFVRMRVGARLWRALCVAWSSGSWCADLSVIPTVCPTCFFWREGWTAIPNKAFTQVLPSCVETVAMPSLAPLEEGSPAISSYTLQVSCFGSGLALSFSYTWKTRFGCRSLGSHRSPQLTTLQPTDLRVKGPAFAVNCGLGMNVTRVAIKHGAPCNERSTVPLDGHPV